VVWECVSCDAEAEPGTLWAVGWFLGGCGRLCPRCLELLEAGQPLSLGRGIQVITLKGGE